MERIELLRVGTWQGFEITEKMLEHLAANFSDRIPVDDGMPPSPGVVEIPFGWVVAVKKEGNVLIGNMEPTRRGAEILKAYGLEKAEFRWAATIQVDYRDPSTGERNKVRLRSVIFERIPLARDEASVIKSTDWKAQLMSEFQKLKDLGCIDDMPPEPVVSWDPITKTINTELSPPPGYTWVFDAETGEPILAKMGVIVRQTVSE